VTVKAFYIEKGRQAESPL